MSASFFQGLGDFPIAVVIFAGVALFLVLRLRSILGRRVGFEKPPVPRDLRAGLGPVIEGRASPVMAARNVPDPQSALGERLMSIVKRDAVFDPPKFLLQAEANFRAIVTAFAAGDRAALRPLLTDPVFTSFDSALATRESAQETQQTDIKSINAATIEDAQLVGDLAAVIVRFSSDQIAVTRNTAGETVGGTEAVLEHVDLWTFERNLKSKDNTWRLAAARNG
jgi:predicted lipid-binding transport protein (Tim44 family)